MIQQLTLTKYHELPARLRSPSKLAIILTYRRFTNTLVNVDSSETNKCLNTFTYTPTEVAPNELVLDTRRRKSRRRTAALGSTPSCSLYSARSLAPLSLGTSPPRPSNSPGRTRTAPTTLSQDEGKVGNVTKLFHWLLRYVPLEHLAAWVYLGTISTSFLVYLPFVALD